ncbi:MAG: 2-amino-4-hydroxy-6-hydroxymethyldihydropteridine diphosphokinase [Nitrospirae bacterium]|nr:2-amino-4-hydroxy-6-hydroxymethyldihydropteridine diphosphokinase [Nitrospirota bacterium]
MSIAYIGIGSNLGNREENCNNAINLLKENGIVIKKQSSMHETAPWGIKDQPKFMNMAIEIETDKTPEELLNVLKYIEKTMGREDAQRWGPRIIDLDILFYDDVILKTQELEIPHSHMHEREFVLKPLCEIAPDLRHPVTGKTIRKMLNSFL